MFEIVSIKSQAYLDNGTNKIKFHVSGIGILHRIQPEKVTTVM